MSALPISVQHSIGYMNQRFKEVWKGMNKTVYIPRWHDFFYRKNPKLSIKQKTRTEC